MGRLRGIYWLIVKLAITITVTTKSRLKGMSNELLRIRLSVDKEPERSKPKLNNSFGCLKGY